MRSTSSLLRASAQLLVLAMASLVLVVLGCTGAQAFPQTVTSPAVTSAVLPVAAPAASSSSTDSGTDTDTDTDTDTVHSSDSLSALAPNLDKPACIPGRDKVRLEQNAVSPGQLLLPSQRGTFTGALLFSAPSEAGLLARSGRIPAAPTHLDLGIVRT